MIDNRAVRAMLTALVLAAFVAGCGDTFRPTINLQPQPGGDNQTIGEAVVLSTNPAGDGSDTHIDVSGDTNVGVVSTGPNPLFLGKASGRVFVINSDKTVTIYSSIGPLTSLITTLVLPGTTAGTIAGATSSNGNVYLANSGSNDVTVIPGTQNVVTNVIPVGARPVMVAANSASSKAYVINHDDNTVTVIGTADNAVLKTIPVGVQPIWAVMSDDGVDVFVVNQGDGTVSVIDTTLDQVICNPASSAPCTSTVNLNGSGTSAALNSNFAFYDNVRKRVYVTNPGDNSVTVIKADSINLGVTPQVLPVFLAKVQLSGSPLSVAAIADGTRAYAALAGCPVGTNHTNLLANLASCNGNHVSVIDVVGLRESKVITVGAGSVSVASSTDGTKIYTANAHDGNISIIKTSTDTELMRMAAPQQSLSCSNPSSCPANVTQTPFMVVTFP
jgi:YVTN family beta-propeller protein